MRSYLVRIPRGDIVLAEDVNEIVMSIGESKNGLCAAESQTARRYLRLPDARENLTRDVVLFAGCSLFQLSHGTVEKCGHNVRLLIVVRLRRLVAVVTNRALTIVH
jgi:hypothetical protein